MREHVISLCGAKRAQILVSLIAIVCIVGMVPAIAFAATYKIAYPIASAYQGGLHGNINYTLSCPNPAAVEAGTLVVMTVTGGNPGNAPYEVSFAKPWTSEEGGPDKITIPGHPITRSYENPNQFSFIMPEQNVDFWITCAKEQPATVNPYITPDPGTARPASNDGLVPAIPYRGFTTNGQPQVRPMADLIDGATEFLVQMTDGSTAGDFGTVDFSSGHIVYTPNAAAAGKTILIKVKGVNGGTVTPETIFTVAVEEIKLHTDASLLTLTYSIEDGVNDVAIPLERGVYDYTIKLPKGTPIGKVITLAATLSDPYAQIIKINDPVISVAYGSVTTEVIIEAEDPTVTGTYTVVFELEKPDEGTDPIDPATNEPGDEKPLQPAENPTSTPNGDDAGGSKDGGKGANTGDSVSQLMLSILAGLSSLGIASIALRGRKDSVD